MESTILEFLCEHQISGRYQHPIVHPYAIRGIALLLRDANQFVAFEKFRHLLHHHQSILADIRYPALEVKNAAHPTHIDLRGGISLPGQVSCQLTRAFFVRALRQPEEKMILSLAYIASIERSRGFNLNHGGKE